MINDIKEMGVVEWSPSQKQFHTYTVGEMLEANLQAALHGTDADYIVIAILPTELKADKTAEVIEAKMREHGRL